MRMKSFGFLFFVIPVMLLTGVACNSGTSASEADQQQGGSVEEGTALSLESAALVPSQVTLAPSEGSLTVTGVEGSLASPDSSSEASTCSDLQVVLTIGDEAASAAVAADCSFTVSTSIPSGQTSAELSVTSSSDTQALKANALAVEADTQALSYRFDIPESETTMADALVGDGELVSFDTPDANTDYTLCIIETESLTSACSQEGDCSDVNSGSSSRVSVILPEGYTAELYGTRDGEDPSCETRSTETSAQVAAGETSFTEEEAAYDQNIAISGNEIETIYEEGDEEVLALSVPYAIQTVDPRSVESPYAQFVNVNLSNLKLALTSEAGQQYRPALSSGTCTAEAPCKSTTTAYRFVIKPGTSQMVPATVGGETSKTVRKRVESRVRAGAVSYDYDGNVVESTCTLTDFIVDPLPTFTTTITTGDNYLAYVFTRGMSLAEVVITYIRVKISRDFDNFAVHYTLVCGAYSSAVSYDLTEFIDPLSPNTIQTSVLFDKEYLIDPSPHYPGDRVSIPVKSKHVMVRRVYDEPVAGVFGSMTLEYQ